MTLSVPVWKSADVLVVGGTTAGVTAALESAAAGRRTVLLADDPYLGSDLGGALQLWPTGDDPLLSAAFASCEENPARPAALKHSLELHLVNAGIPFLFGTRPIGLLRDDSGFLVGCVFSARTSIFAVLGSQLVDATTFGLLARLSGVSLAARPACDQVKWRILGDARPNWWPGEITPIEPAYRQTLKDGPRDYAAFELRIARETLSSDARSLSHVSRSFLVDERIWVAADHLIDPGEYCLPGEPFRSPGAVADGTFEMERGLWMVNRLLPVNDFEGLCDPFQMAPLGRRLGRLTAGTPPRRPTPPAFLQCGGAGSGRIAFTKTFLRGDGGEIEIPVPSFPVWNDYDVVVAGGGTGGAPAAIAAARAGVRALCVEAGHGLGGVGTLGLISSYWFGNKCGFTAELNEAQSIHDGISRQKKGNSWHPGVKSSLYHRLLREAGGTAWLGSWVAGVLREGNRPTGVLVTTPHGVGFVPARTFVDATGNADLAAAAGAACRVMDGQHAAVQGTGISPRVYPSVPHQNSDHTFIDENDPEGLTLAHVQARAKYPNDFETTAFVNSRERRQIRGELEVSPLDILAGRTFPDTLFTARSNFDTHGFIIHPVFMVAPPDHKPLQAHVPLRCMIPAGVEGVLVTGLGMSAHRDALPVIRMQADVQNQGYAAGLLAAQCARTGEGFRQIDVKAFQRTLVETGILDAETAAHSDSFPLSEAQVHRAATGPLDNARDVAIVFAHPKVAIPALRLRIHDAADPAGKRQAALILGLLGDTHAGDSLVAWIDESSWDEGWNYRGMGQFGASMSPLDAAIIALGRTGHPDAGRVLTRLARHPAAALAFSHCRALAIAAASLRSPELTAALDDLLRSPGVQGHAFLEPEDILRDCDGSPVATESRNLSLRELYLARGVFLAGDPTRRGREILERYARDLRGHFASHARSLLAGVTMSGQELA